MQFREPVEWISNLVKSHSARIRIRDIRGSPEGPRDLVEIFSPEGRIEGLSSQLAAELDSRKENLSLVDGNRATAIVNAKTCAICSAMLKWDLFLVEAHSTDAGDIIMKWLVPDEATVSGFMDRMEKDGVNFRLLRKRNISRKGEITARQEYVVKTALDLGFFDYPKRINLEGLSSRLNVSYATLAEILRRAEKNIIASYFRKKDE